MGTQEERAMSGTRTMTFQLLASLAIGTVCLVSNVQCEESKDIAKSREIQALTVSLESKDWQRRTRALASLKKMVESCTDSEMAVFSPVVEPLMSLVGWGGEARRDAQTAAHLLAKIGKLAVPKLLQALKSPEARLRWSAAELLTSIGPAKAPVVKAISPLLSDKDPYVRRLAIQCLGRLGEDARETLPLLKKALKDTFPTNRIYCHMALIRISGRSKPHVEGITSFLRHDDPDVRCLAGLKLGECGIRARDSWRELLRCLADDEEQVRIYAAGSLGDIGADSKEVIAALIDVLGHGGEAARSAAVSLGQIGPKARDAVPALGEALKRGGGWWVAADALGNIGGAEVVPILTGALKNRDVDIRLASARQLGKQGPLSSAALPSLKECLADERESVRRAAAESIRKIEEAIGERRKDK